MATGDILSATIGTDGWYADIVIEGLSDAGTYSFGLGANNDPATGTPKVTFTVVSLGYDDTGSATTITRTVYGTKQVRKPYPDNALNEESEGGGNLTVRVALSDYIYAKDIAGAGFVENVSSGTAPTCAILSGFYTEAGGDGGTANNARTSFTVTNSSTAAYPNVIANWSWPGYQLMNSSSKLRAVAFHGSAQSGRPVRCVKFSVTDGSTTNTETLTAPVIESSLTDLVPVVEYVTTTNLVSGLTAKAELTCNFIAYPWIGDADAVLDTSAGTAAPTPRYGPIKMVCDNAGTYEQTVALVDPTGSDAGANTVYPASSFNPATAYKFATIGKAAAALAAYNNTNYGRNDVGAGTVYLNAGTYAWLGSSNTYGTTPKAWLTITPSAGVARADVAISTQSGNSDISDRVKLQNLTISGSAAFLVVSCAALWIDQCIVSATGAATINNGITSYWTRNVMAGFVQGIVPSTLWTSAPALVRSNNLDSFTKSIMGYTVIGNRKITADTGSSIIIGDLGTAGQQGMPHADNAIVAYNRITGNAGNPIINWNFVNARNHGLALVQNVFENWDNGSQALGDLSGSGVATPVNNVLNWHNIFVGGRTLNAYNDAGSTALIRKYWSEKNTINDYYAIKSDTFNNVGNGGQDGTRVGNWPEVFGVSSSGNVVASITGFASISFLKEFPGIKVLQNSSLQANDYVKYTDDKSYKGGSDTAGGGTYTLQSSSPAKGLQRDWLLPYDLAGNPRTSTSDAGAYAPVAVNRRNNTWRPVNARVLTTP